MPPLRICVETAEGQSSEPGLAEAIETAIRTKLIFIAKIELVAFNSLPRSDYKSRLVDYAEATD